MMVLIPLTVDRFVAIVFPRKYLVWVTRKTSMALILLCWVPMIAVNIVYDSIRHATGKVKVRPDRLV